MPPARGSGGARCGSSSASASVNPPYSAAATLSGWPSRPRGQREQLVGLDRSAADRRAEHDAGHDGGGAAAEPAGRRDHARDLEPPRRGAGRGRDAQALAEGADEQVVVGGLVVARGALAARVEHDAGLVAVPQLGAQLERQRRPRSSRTRCRGWRSRRERRRWRWAACVAEYRVAPTSSGRAAARPTSDAAHATSRGGIGAPRCDTARHDPHRPAPTSRRAAAPRPRRRCATTRSCGSARSSPTAARTSCRSGSTGTASGSSPSASRTRARSTTCATSRA